MSKPTTPIWWWPFCLFCLWHIPTKPDYVLLLGADQFCFLHPWSPHVQSSQRLLCRLSWKNHGYPNSEKKTTHVGWRNSQRQWGAPKSWLGIHLAQVHKLCLSVQMAQLLWKAEQSWPAEVSTTASSKTKMGIGCSWRCIGCDTYMKPRYISLAIDCSSTSLLLGDFNNTVKHHRCNSKLFRLISLSLSPKGLNIGSKMISSSQRRRMANLGCMSKFSAAPALMTCSWK